MSDEIKQLFDDYQAGQTGPGREKRLLNLAVRLAKANRHLTAALLVSQRRYAELADVVKEAHGEME